ncbi:MAG: right-handed parallel beta-helix repeat-containing protein [Prolixibacteraceae bacterium]
MKLKLVKNLVVLSLILLIACSVSAKEIWVSPSGSRENPGTKEKPLASIQMAQRLARELRRLNDPSIKGGIQIILKGGIYQLDEPLLFRPEDSGTSESPTTIIAAPGEEPIISGGVQVKNWKKLNGTVVGLPKAASGKIWVTDIPEVGGRKLEFRQLWVNGIKAQRASTLTDGKLNRILSVDKPNQIMWIPKPAFAIKEIKQLELVIHQWWAIANLRVKNIRVMGDSAAVTFHQPESRIEFEHPWPAPFIDAKKDKNGNSAFWFTNAVELLNQPGEWYEDFTTGKLYYWPLENQEMTTAEVIAPNLESIVQLNGSPDFPVRNIHFSGINFQHTSWMRPSKAGHVPLQAGMYLLDAYKLMVPGTPDKKRLENQAWIGRQSAAVEASYANGLVFERCNFRHLSATGLDLIVGAGNDRVTGCSFTDIGGTAIQSGFFGTADFEAHLPYNPTDERDVCRYLTITNNLISDATNEDWGCVGIGIGFARNVIISHNEVRDVNYSGISLGWGWTRTINCMRNNLIHGNLIHHFAKQMYDVGGIYTLSAQPNTEISGNCIHHLEKAPYAHDPKHYQYIYFDEGSSYIRAINNWTEADKFFSNTPGPGNEWINNGPQVADSIKVQAGIQKEFQDILKNK